ncbi:uncharacterized protein RMCC_5316 [Mycolicibacterium canariasense]|uniref:Uncharacterized protein n=1 Tax=Mycolicibacterium canariasense TaxID=228230 RepID=A0A100WHL7_MYCCR|nr:uncharacterized protein RMCC_5316 [Mycolicibacterium canariasense]
MPITMMVNGIQNHTVPIAAPATMEAVGTTPIVRWWGTTVVAASVRSAVSAGVLDVIATMRPTYGYALPGDTAFSAEPCGG